MRTSYCAHYSYRPPSPVWLQGLGRHSEFTSPALSYQSTEVNRLLGKGRLLPLSGLRSTIRPCLRAPMGGAWQRLRMSLLGWSDDIAGHASGCPRTTHPTRGRGDRKQENFRPFCWSVTPTVLETPSDQISLQSYDLTKARLRLHLTVSVFATRIQATHAFIARLGPYPRWAIDPQLSPGEATL